MSTPTKNRTERLRAEREAALVRKAKERRRRIVLLAVGGVLAVAAIVGIAIGAADSSRRAGSGSLVPPGVTSAGGIVLGDAGAPIKAVLYSDPQCPVCARFERETGTLLEQAVRDGKVSLEYRMRSFLGPESVRAVNALGAAHAEGKFQEYYDTLFANQPPERTDGYRASTLIELGDQIGLTSDAFRSAVKDMKYEAWVHRTDEQGSKDGNVGTPELRVNGTPVPQDAMFDEAAFRKAVGI